MGEPDMVSASSRGDFEAMRRALQQDDRFVSLIECPEAEPGRRWEIAFRDRGEMYDHTEHDLVQKAYDTWKPVDRLTGERV
jgi:hypothetical protein